MRGRVLPMAEFRTTKASSSSKKVMPDAVSTRSEFKPDVEFAGGGETDWIVVGPSTREFDDVMKRARREARLAGMTRSDIASAIAAVRSQ